VKAYGFLVLSLSLLGACADSVAPTNNNSSGGKTTRSTTVSTTTNRLCMDMVISNSGSTLASRLEDLFVKGDVSNIEDNVGYCLEIEGTGDTAYGWLRIEYEDDYGISSLDTDRDGFSIVVGEFKKTSSSDERKLVNFIFSDNYGMVQVKATESAAGSKQYTGSIRFYNFPSYEEAMQDAIDEAVQKCRSGEWTVAKCLGYAPPTYWWNETSSSTSLKDEANSLLSGSSSKTLGNISFTAGEVVIQ
jgi:hypothetical protein